MMENAIALACMMAASPVTAATMCGRMPSVQANAATRLARHPREIPAATAYSTPAPGVATTISVVSKTSGVTERNAFAAEHPGILERPVPLRLLGSPVFVVGTARCLGLLPLQRLPELAFGVVFRCLCRFPGRFAPALRCHARSVSRPTHGRRVLYRLPGGIPYTW